MDERKAIISESVRPLISCLAEIEDPSGIDKFTSGINCNDNEIEITITKGYDDFIDEVSSIVNTNQLAKPHVLVTMNSITFERRSKYIKWRQFLTESKVVKSVILMPDRLISRSNVNFTIIVLAPDRDKIMFVNAKDCFTEENGIVSLSLDNVRSIINATKEETENSKLVAAEDLVEGYCLSPMPYLRVKQGNGIELSAAIVKHIKGLQIRPDDLLEYIISEKSKYRSLTNRDISKRSYLSELDHLSDVPESFLNHEVIAPAIVFNKIGNSYMVIKEIPEDEHIILTGRSFAFTVNESVVSLDQLVEFFSSPQGKAALAACSFGNAVAQINEEYLKEVIVS